MVNGYYAERGEVKRDGIETLSKKATLIWLDCINPTHKELKEISEKTGISMDDFEQGLDVDERPRINLSEGYAQIIFKTPQKIKNNVETISFSIFIFNDKIITVRKTPLDVFHNLKLLPEQKMAEILQKDPTTLLFIILDDVISEYFRITDPIEELIERIDNHLFQNFKDERVIKEIFDIRKTLIFIHKALVANREVLSGIEAQYLTQIKKGDIKKFRFLHNDVTQLIDMATTYREVIGGSLEVYMTKVSNNLNQVMKRLTVYASYVMVPTLISGIYGMNFRFLPEINWKYGYFFALGLMVLSIVMMHLLFKKKGWI